MTNEEAIDYVLDNISLKVWLRVLYLAGFYAFGWWFWTPLFWAISPKFAGNSFYIIVPIFILSALVGGLMSLKLYKALWALKKLGYKKWRWIQWNPKLIKKGFDSLLPNKQERIKYPWLEPYSVGAFIFSVMGIIIFFLALFSQA
ncbi:MAG: hypothetical protein GY943_19900 [Chloroflexi bacterium]|nr:hypothetical protein [Chloroflexota bacterium]